MPKFNIAIFLIGCVGGLLPDVLRLIKGRFSENVFKQFTENYNWIFTILLSLLGGFVVWLLNIQEATGAIAYGFSAPQVIESLAAKADQPKPAQTPEGGGMVHVSTGGKAPELPIPPKAEKKSSIRSWWAY